MHKIEINCYENFFCLAEVDLDGTILFLSSSLLELLGYEYFDVVGKILRIL